MRPSQPSSIRAKHNTGALGTEGNLIPHQAD